jgi:hypothetical protein
VVARSAGRYLVIAFFDTRAEARGALLAAPIEASSESGEGAFGMLASDDHGRPETVCSSGRTVERSHIGAVLGLIASALLGGVMPARTHFFGTLSDLTTDDVVRFGAELEAGHAAVAALAPRTRADRLVVLLTGLGGKTEIHQLSVRALLGTASTDSPSDSIRW